MILGFVIVLSIVGISLALVMYAALLPFIGTLGDIKEYNMAYYGAQSALERSLLVLREREAGFEGEGGGTGNTFVGPVSDRVEGFGGFEREGNSLYRHIAGRDAQVPSVGKGMIEPYLLSGSSNDYNILGYTHPQTIPLRYDATMPLEAYKVGDNSLRFLSGAGLGLDVYLVLNDTIRNLFAAQGSMGGTLASDEDYDGDGTSDDIAVDRSWKGRYHDIATLQSGAFTILPRSLVFYNSGGVGSVSSDDEAIRERVVNAVSATTPALRISSLFNQGAYNPLSTVSTPNALSHRMITDYDIVSGISFGDMLAGGSADIFVTQQALTLSLFSPLMTSIGTLYPFIQYKVVCDGCDSLASSGGPQLAQPYFIIHGESKIGEYSVKMQMRKSVDDKGVVSQFTVIF